MSMLYFKAECCMLWLCYQSGLQYIANNCVVSMPTNSITTLMIQEERWLAVRWWLYLHRDKFCLNCMYCRVWRISWCADSYKFHRWRWQCACCCKLQHRRSDKRSSQWVWCGLWWHKDISDRSSQLWCVWPWQGEWTTTNTYHASLTCSAVTRCLLVLVWFLSENCSFGFWFSFLCLCHDGIKNRT